MSEGFRVGDKVTFRAGRSASMFSGEVVRDEGAGRSRFLIVKSDDKERKVRPGACSLAK